MMIAAGPMIYHSGILPPSKRPIPENLPTVRHFTYPRVSSSWSAHKQNHAGGYNLKAQSPRKFFKTQLMALGVNSDYVDYMMGHTVDTYHDIESKGIEFLRNVYASAGLSTKPKVQTSKIEMVKEVIARAHHCTSLLFCSASR